MRRKIVVGNVDGESQVGERERQTREMDVVSSIVANRLTWLAAAGDILLLPAPIGPEFKRYALTLMGVDASAVHVESVGGDVRDIHVLAYEVLANPALHDRLLARMRGEGEWDMLPYYFDRAAAYLASRLGCRVEPRLHRYLSHGGAEMLNSKSEFRRMASALGVPIAEGTTCFSRLELARAIGAFIGETGCVMVKQDFNAGGDGNVVVSRGVPPEEVKGARGVMALGPGEDTSEVASILWRKLTGERNRALIVEAYHLAKSVFYSELEVPGDGGRPVLLNFGDMRMEPLWNGFEIPPRSLAPSALAEFIARSVVLADAARERGYAGKINCDGVLTRDDAVFFTEINGRLGGCTHVHVVAERLYGAGYAARHTVMTRNKTAVTTSFGGLLKNLDAEGLLVTGPAEEGVIVLTEDIERSGTIEYMVTGKGEERALEIERAAQGVFQRGDGR